MSFIGGQIPSGVIFDYAGPTAPQGYLLCFGQVVSRTTYAALFSVIGTQYGAGDGSTTFGLPDLRGRSVSGKDDMGGVAANRVTNGVSGIAGVTLGAVGGSEAMQAHLHGVGTLVNAASALSGATAAAQAWSGSANTTGSSHTHDYTFRTPSGFVASAPDSNFMVLSSQATGQSAVPNMTGGTHTHTVSGSNSASSVTGTANAQAISGSVASTGAGASQNMIPTIILNKIIKV